MESKFKVGDRVRAYWPTHSSVGTIERIEHGGNLLIIPSGIHAHPKQCRKLVKKPRRRVWIHAQELSFLLGKFHTYPEVGAIEFIEVKQKKQV